MVRDRQRALSRWSVLTLWLMLAFFALVALANAYDLVSVPGDRQWIEAPVPLIFVGLFGAGAAACVAEIQHRSTERSLSEPETGA